MNIEINTSLKCFSEESIIINAPSYKVFNIISDINNWPVWLSDVKKAEISKIASQGVKFVWLASGMKISSVFHTVTPFSEIGWTGKMIWIKAIHNWFLTDINGKTKVVVKETLEGLGSSFMKKTLKDGMIKSLSELKEYAEKENQ